MNVDEKESADEDNEGKMDSRRASKIGKKLKVKSGVLNI